MKTKIFGIAMLLACVLLFVGCPQPETPEAPSFPAIEILPVTIGNVSFVNFKGAPLTEITNPKLSSVKGKVNAIDSSVSYLNGGWDSNVFSLTSSSTIDGNDWNDFKKQIQKNSSAEIVYSVDDFFPDNVVVSVISQVSAGNFKFVNIDGELLEGYLLEDTITKINALEASPGNPLITKMFDNPWDVTNADITLSNANAEPFLGDWTKLKDGVNALSTEDVRVRFNDKDTENVEIEVTDEIKIGKISLVNLAGEPLVDTAAIEIVTAKITDPLNTNFAGLFALPWDIAYSDYIPQESMVSINAWNTFVENIKVMNDASILEVRIDDSDKENVIVTVNNGYVVDSFTLIGFDGNELSAETVPSVADIAELLNTETPLESMFGAVWNEDSAIYQPSKDTSYVTVTDLATLVAEIDALNTDFLSVTVSETVLETGAKAYTIKVEKPYSRITFTGPNNSPLSESILNTTRTIISGIQSGKWNQHVFTPSSDIADWETFKASLNAGLTKNNLVGIVNEDNRADIYVTIKDTLDIEGFTLENDSSLKDSVIQTMLSDDLTGDVYGGSWNGNYFNFTNTEISIAGSTTFVNDLSTGLKDTNKIVLNSKNHFILIDVNTSNVENLVVTVRDPVFYVKSLGGSDSNDGKTLATAFATPQKAVDEIQKLFKTMPDIDYGIKMDGTFAHTKNSAMVNISNTTNDALDIQIESATNTRAVLDAKHKGYVINVYGKVYLGISKVSLSNGKTAGLRAQGQGNVFNGSEIWDVPNIGISESRISGSSGVGVSIGNSYVTFSSTNIEDNTKSGITAYNSYVTLGFHATVQRNATINSSASGLSGTGAHHGIYASNSEITINSAYVDVTHNGHKTKGNGVYLTNGSVLRSQGKIYSHLGSGVYVSSDSEFYMTWGAIYNNGYVTASGGVDKFNGAFNGGGVHNDGTFIMWENATVYDNYARYDGGGIYNGSNASFTLSGKRDANDDSPSGYRNQIYGNEAEDGAGVYNNGTFTMGDYARIGYSSDTDGYKNKASANGGAVYNSTSGIFTMNANSVIANGIATNSGGGVYNRGTFSMKAGFITQNQAVNNDGGGVSNDSNGTFTMTGGAISLNESGDDGGGIYNGGGTIIINGSTADITQNEARGDGGGIYSRVYNSKATLSLLHGRIDYNKTYGFGGGGVAYESGTAYTKNVNCSVVDNRRVFSNGSSTESDIWAY